MALGTNHITGRLQGTDGTAAVFTPEEWEDDVIVAYKSNLVAANNVTKMNHSGRKGDTIHIPKPTRGTASVKATSTQVTVIADSNTDLPIYIDEHWEYSRVIEDVAAVQALNSMRQFYTDDGGYALATQVDYLLLSLLKGAQGGTKDTTPGTPAAQTITWASDKIVTGGDGSTIYTGLNESALSDAGIRTMIQTLDDNDVPQSERYFIVPPVERNNLMGIARFTEQAFVGEVGQGNTIRNGLIGDIYGIPVFVSTNCPKGDSSDRIGGLFHKSATVLVEQMGVRAQTQYKQEYLADLLTFDTLFGFDILRDDAMVGFAVPS